MQVQLRTGQCVRKVVPRRNRLSLAGCRGVAKTLVFPSALPVLPFPPQEVLTPGATKALHLYEARYLTLLEAVLATPQRMFVHAVCQESAAPRGGVAPPGELYIDGGRLKDGQSAGGVSLLMGCLVQVISVLPLRVGASVRIQGLGRVALGALRQTEPFMMVSVDPLTDHAACDPAAAAAAVAAALACKESDSETLADAFIRALPSVRRMMRAEQAEAISSASLAQGEAGGQPGGTSGDADGSDIARGYEGSCLGDGEASSSDASGPQRRWPKGDLAAQAEQLRGVLRDLQNLSMKFRCEETANLQQAMLWADCLPGSGVCPLVDGHLPLPGSAKQGTSGSPGSSLACTSSTPPAVTTGGTAAGNGPDTTPANAGGTDGNGDDSGSTSEGAAAAARPRQPTPAQQERACRVAFAALQALPQATPQERFALARQRVLAMETRDTAQRLRQVLAYTRNARDLLAAKCALKALNL